VTAPAAAAPAGDLDWRPKPVRSNSSRRRSSPLRVLSGTESVMGDVEEDWEAEVQHKVPGGGGAPPPPPSSLARIGRTSLPRLVQILCEQNFVRDTDRA